MAYNLPLTRHFQQFLLSPGLGSQNCNISTGKWPLGRPRNRWENGSQIKKLTAEAVATSMTTEFKQ